VHLERTQQVAGLTETCQHERLTRRKLFTQGPSRAQSVDPRKIDVDDRDVGPGLECGLDNSVAAVQLGDDIDVRLEAQEGDQGTADHMHVLGDQHLDHKASSGTSNVSAPRVGHSR
jgi:hypothetical protein